MDLNLKLLIAMMVKFWLMKNVYKITLKIYLLKEFWTLEEIKISNSSGKSLVIIVIFILMNYFFYNNKFNLGDNKTGIFIMEYNVLKWIGIGFGKAMKGADMVYVNI